MQAANIWHKLHIYRHQVIGLLLLTVLAAPASAQNYNTDNLIDYDNEWIHYGFLMGVHSSKYRIQYADRYSSPLLDSLHSAAPENTAGWRVGFVVNMRLIDKWVDVRLLPTIGFYQYRITYRYTDGRQHTELKDATTVELPTLLKFKSARWGNVAMYAVGGANPALEVAGKGDNFDTQNNIKLRNFNVSFDAGVGFDLYFPLFKFSPEIRYTWGMRDMLPSSGGPYTDPFKRLTFENVAFYITFEGGPTYLRNIRKANRKKR